MTIEPVLAAHFQNSGGVGKGSSGLKADEVCRINSEKPDVHREREVGGKFSIFQYTRSIGKTT